jgi:hypothetical protein
MLPSPKMILWKWGQLPQLGWTLRTNHSCYPIPAGTWGQWQWHLAQNSLSHFELWEDTKDCSFSEITPHGVFLHCTRGIESEDEENTYTTHGIIWAHITIMTLELSRRPSLVVDVDMVRIEIDTLSADGLLSPVEVLVQIHMKWLPVRSGVCFLKVTLLLGRAPETSCFSHHSWAAVFPSIKWDSCSRIISRVVSGFQNSLIIVSPLSIHCPFPQIIILLFV